MKPMDILTEKIVRNITMLLIVCLVFSGLYAQTSEKSERGMEKTVIRWSRGNSINEYLDRYKDASYPAQSIIINAVDYTNSQEAELAILDEWKGKKNVLSWTGESGSVDWKFTAESSGLYHISLDYIPLPFKGMNIEFELKIDGVIPHDDFMSVRFSRIWTDVGEIKRDANDNDLVPDQIETPQWTTRNFIDTQGFYNKSLPVYIEKGEHVLTLVLKREALVIDKIVFKNDSDISTYSDINTIYKEKGYKSPSNKIVKVQGEKTIAKSDSTLIPTYDRIDAATEPAHPAKIRLNTFGGNWTWKLPGQWAEWSIDVPESGLYRIFVKGRQNFQRGMSAVRKVYVDGEIPYMEFENLEFPYSLEWNQITPKTSSGEECMLYLEKGVHKIRLESTLGRLTPILTAVDDLTYEVNTLRRRFVMIMGSEPDVYRDYQLEKEIPGLTEKLIDLSKRFNEQADLFEEIAGQKGSEAATLRIMRDQLASFAEKPQYIPHKQTNFRDNIANLATWILYRKEIPLEIDYLGIASADAKIPTPKAGFFQQGWMNICAFIASFFEDYNSIGAQEKNAVSVWIQSGRDQANILRDMITNDFTPKTGIKVNLSLVQASLIEATLAGRGPEIAIQVARGQPVDLAARNALYDLSTFEDFDEIKKRFYPSAMTPYEYQGGVYGIPLTQDFHMMFYRTDILNELGLEPPQTWDDVYAMIPILQRNNMQIGLPYQQTDSADLISAGIGARNLFSTLLVQNDGAFYLNNNSETGLSTPEAYNAFKQWIDFYAAYGFTLKFDFYTRFRSGEMPIGIAGYNLYNQFVAAAPEIRNEWKMAPIPGIRQEDGSIDRKEGASGSAVIMFKNIKNPEAGYEFLKWWTSSDVQYKYATQMETMLGTAARLTTANIDTFDKLPWSKKEGDLIKNQWKNVVEIPEVPGGYYSIRMLDTAFSVVFYQNKNARATLTKYSEMINEEIERKRKELGIDK